MKTIIFTLLLISSTAIAKVATIRATFLEMPKDQAQVILDKSSELNGFKSFVTVLTTDNEAFFDQIQATDQVKIEISIPVYPSKISIALTNDKSEHLVYGRNRQSWYGKNGGRIVHFIPELRTLVYRIQENPQDKSSPARYEIHIRRLSDGHYVLIQTPSDG